MWPSIVVEVRWTETRTALERYDFLPQQMDRRLSQNNMSRDIEFWLLESDRDVKVALSLTVIPDPERAIIIERWIIKNAGSPPRPEHNSPTWDSISMAA